MIKFINARLFHKMLRPVNAGPQGIAVTTLDEGYPMSGVVANQHAQKVRHQVRNSKLGIDNFLLPEWVRDV